MGGKSSPPAAKDLKPAGTLTFDAATGATKEHGAAKFVFADETGTKRILRIENDIESANMGIRPVLTFKFAKVSSWMLPASVEFRVAGAELSGTMRGMEMLTTMFYKNYVMTE